MSRIIILSGPLGAGKSTAAMELLKLLETRTAYIEGDVFWQFVSHGAHFDRSRRREMFHPLMRSMMGAAWQFARSGVDVLLDFTLPPEFLPTALRIAKDVPLDYVLFCPSEAVCAERARKRTPGSVADYSMYSDFYRMFAEAQLPMVREDSADAVTIAKQIHARLDAGEFRVAK